jgi:WD40 repeat protein
MTPTEDRLTAALESAAATVRAETMRPLTAPEPGRPGQARSHGRGANGHGYQRRAWLTAVAAAASIAVIAGALVTLKSQQPAPRPVRAGAYIGGSEPAVPAFFAGPGPGLNSQQLRVASLATGAVTATEHAPVGTEELEFLAEQAQTGNWVAVYSTRQSRELLYRFSITGTGKLTRLTRIKGITLKPQSEDLTVLALSPDGSRLALSQIPPGESTVAYNRFIVLNLKTGAQQVWKDRLVDGAYQPSITSAVWTPDGRSLVFASQMCKVSSVTLDTGPCFWQFRNLRTPPASGGFQAGPVLLRQSGMGGVNQAPAIAPGARSVVEVRHGTSPGGDFTVVRVDLATGKQVVLHRLGAPGPYQVGLNEGNFILVAQTAHSGSKAVVRGWTDDRGFHPVTYRLPIN